MSRAFVGLIWRSSAAVLFFFEIMDQARSVLPEIWCKTMADSGASIPIDFHLLYG